MVSSLHGDMILMLWDWFLVSTFWSKPFYPIDTSFRSFCYFHLPDLVSGTLHSCSAFDLGLMSMRRFPIKSMLVTSRNIQACKCVDVSNLKLCLG